MTLNGFLAGNSDRDMEVCYIGTQKAPLFQAAVFDEMEKVIAVGAGGDILSAIQNAEQHLIEQMRDQSAEETK
jgi:hypothetical protein